MFWCHRQIEQPESKATTPTPVLTIIPEVSPEIVYDEKEEELVREYCASCITPEGEIKCPRRHRCKTCHCYLTDEEWFAQNKK